MKCLPMMMTLVMTSMAWGEELPKGEELAKIVAEKCQGGCTVYTASELEEIQEKLQQLYTELREMSTRRGLEEGARSCRIYYDAPPRFGGRGHPGEGEE
jgi:hypothetical protein